MREEFTLEGFEQFINVYDGETGEFLYKQYVVNNVPIIKALQEGNAVEVWEWRSVINYKDSRIEIDEDGFAHLVEK